MDRHSTPPDVLQNALICGRLPPLIVIGLKPIDGDDYAEPRELCPMRRDRPKRAGYKLNIYTLLIEFGQDFFQLAVTYERIAAHQRDMQRAIFVDKIEYSLDEGVLFVVGKNPKSNAVPTEMRVVVGIAAGTAKRALPRNFNREERLSTLKDGGPGLEKFLCLHVIPLKPASGGFLYSTVTDGLRNRRGNERKALALLDAVCLNRKGSDQRAGVDPQHELPRCYQAGMEGAAEQKRATGKGKHQQDNDLQ
jgi:hypothetical protein